MSEIKISDLSFNAFDLLPNWALVSAGTKANYDAMTISWGGFGSLWNKYVATIYIRPQRYTKNLLDKEDYYTISFFDSKYKNDLIYLGRTSKNDTLDKMSNINITPIIKDNIITYPEATITFVCKKMYHSPLIKEGFTDTNLITENYSHNDFSIIYIGEIVKILKKEE